MSLINYSIKMPKAVYSGVDSLEKISEIVQNLECTKIAAFTDKGLRELGLFDLVEKQIRKTEKEYRIYDDLPTEPTYLEVQRVIDDFKIGGYDLIIACGGGSVMDVAKLASILVTDEYGVKDLLDDPKRGKKQVQVIMIPTTAGTGAESTPNAIVGVPEKEIKVGIVNDNLIADYVILNVELIKNLPRKLAAATGIDALCHAIECYTSKKANPFSDTFALEALDLIMNNIIKACEDNTSLFEKRNMQIAAFYGGIAITSSGTTAVHALSYPLGGKYHIPHGVSNAILLIPVLKFNEIACRDRLAMAWNRVYHGDLIFDNDEDKSKALLNWIENIVTHLEIPTSLSDFGVSSDDLEMLVDAGMSVTRLLNNNARELNKDDARAIYQEVLK